MILPDPQKTPGAEEALEFLRLLEDVGEIQRDLLAETERLRARVEELEAGHASVPVPAEPAGEPAPAPGQGETP
jgi:hypothetical protein